MNMPPGRCVDPNVLLARASFALSCNATLMKLDMVCGRPFSQVVGTDCVLSVADRRGDCGGDTTHAVIGWLTCSALETRGVIKAGCCLGDEDRTRGPALEAMAGNKCLPPSDWRRGDTKMIFPAEGVMGAASRGGGEAT